MRVTLVPLLLVPLVGCSNLLGIQDPSDGSGSGSGSDAGTDGPMQTGTYLKLNVTTMGLMIGEHARVHVVLMHNADVVKDVSGTSGLMQSSAATVAAPGAVEGGGIRIEGMGPGMAVLTAHYDGADDASLTVNVSTTICHVVINEVVTGTTAHGGTDEFVELYNPCLSQFDTTLWTLDYRAKGSVNTAPDDNMLVQLAGPMNTGDLRLYVGIGFSGTGTVTDMLSSGISEEASIALRNGPKSTGTVIDSFAYGGVDLTNPFIEGTPYGKLTAGMIAVRTGFDGFDTDHNSTDFTNALTATPGTLNFP